MNNFRNITKIIKKYPENVFVQADGFDAALIGVHTSTMRLVYDEQKCLEVLKENGMSYLEAVEYFEFNVADAYMGEKTPIFIDTDFEF